MKSAREEEEEWGWLATDKQHGQAGSAIAPPKFYSASLRKTSAVPGNVMCKKRAQDKDKKLHHPWSR